MDVRSEVLAAAVEICATEGPDAVSMREVARRSGLSHQAPYHHFGDRSGIFASIAEDGFNKLADAMNAVLARDGNHLSECLEAYVGIAHEYPGHFRVMFRQDICGTDTHEATRIAADRGFNTLEVVVERAFARPLSTDEKAVWASVLWSQAHGFSALLIDGPLVAKLPPGTDLDEHIAEFIRVITLMIENQARLESDVSLRK